MNGRDRSVNDRMSTIPAMNVDSYRFTVFTPTHNRAHTLPRVYESLKAQTFRDFEWLIVDDGSTASGLVAQWIGEAIIPIRYIKQAHGHKKVAHNRAVQEARGAFLLPLDSDDELLPDALAILYEAWLGIPEPEREHFTGVCGLCVDESGRVVGDAFPMNCMHSDVLEVRYVHRIEGEKCGFNRVDVLRGYPFPDKIHGYVPESVVWHSIAERYKTCFINRPVRVYHADVESVTRPRRRLEAIRRHAEGHAYLARETLDRELHYFRYRPVWFLKMAANYTRFHCHLAHTQPGKRYSLQRATARVLAWALSPMGWLRYALDCMGI